MNKEVNNAVQEKIPQAPHPVDRAALYGKAADELKGSLIESSVSVDPFGEGTLNKEIASEHSQIIKLQDEMVEKRLEKMGEMLPTVSLPASQFLPQAGMISMQDDDDDSLLQVRERQEHDLQAVLENGHAKLLVTNKTQDT